jgi:serpin B
MSQVLDLGGRNAIDVDQAAASLQHALLRGDSGGQLDIANSLWLHRSGRKIEPEFIQISQRYFDTELGDLAGAPANINAWVAAATHDRIKAILGPDDYDSMVAIIVNTVFFKGRWAASFDPSQTRPGTFTRADGSQKSWPMMSRTGQYPYFRGENFQAVRIAYAQGQLSMVIVLPTSDVPLQRFIGALGTTDIAQWRASLRLSEGTIAVPRFSAEYAVSLPPVLRQLGMGVAFERHRANFDGIAPDVYVSRVEHKTMVQVDEEGTVAAAATSVGVHATALMAPLPRFSLVIDHPFLFVIQDDASGAILFIGACMDPL